MFLVIPQIKTSLTIKPDNFYMHAKTRKDRKDRKVTKIGSAVPPGSPTNDEPTTHDDSGKYANVNGPKLAIFYGSNAGTCKALAYKLRGQAAARGMNVSIATLNTVAADDIPRDRPVAIITASYEGQVRRSIREVSLTELNLFVCFPAAHR